MVLAEKYLFFVIGVSNSMRISAIRSRTRALPKLQRRQFISLSNVNIFQIYRANFSRQFHVVNRIRRISVGSYLFFPFVFELRTVTDWMWTETTLTLSEWLGMEDIFATVFMLKVRGSLPTGCTITDNLRESLSIFCPYSVIETTTISIRTEEVRRSPRVWNFFAAAL